MYFLLISYTTMRLLGPFSGPGTCEDALNKDTQTARVEVPAGKRPAYIAVCFKADSYWHFDPE